MCPVGPEVCGNGCDDDRNGYIDDDDPACTTQMLVTLPLARRRRAVAAHRRADAPRRRARRQSDHHQRRHGHLQRGVRAGGVHRLRRRHQGARPRSDRRRHHHDLRDVLHDARRLRLQRRAHRRRPALGGELPASLHDGWRDRDHAARSRSPTWRLPAPRTAASSSSPRMRRRGASQIVVFDKSATRARRLGRGHRHARRALQRRLHRIVDLVYVKKSGVVHWALRHLRRRPTCAHGS